MFRRLAPFALLATPIALAAQELPSGWTARADRPGRAIAFATMASGFHLSPGGSGIVYRQADKTGDKFHAVATFAQTKPTSHPEAYGLFFAGNELAGEGQRYIYFIVRADGKFQVKRRAGTEVTNLTPWTDHAAIAKAGEDGKAKNTLEIDANGEKVALKVNGTTVYELAEASRAGVVGLRLNHGLDVHIDGFAVHPS